VIANTLLPLILLIATGVLLTRVRMLGPQFAADLNKLAFWVLLPSLLLRESAAATGADATTWRLAIVMLLTTTIVAAGGWLASVLLGIPKAGRGTFVQSAFRGNLGFIGVPVVAASAGELAEPMRSTLISTAVIVMTTTMMYYNILAVTVLQASRPRRSVGAGALFWPILTNPLLVAGLTGLTLSLTGLGLPVPIARTLEVLGNAAVPIAMLCIGASLSTTRMAGTRSWILWAAIFKVAISPVVAAILIGLAGLGPIHLRVAVVFAATSTAAAAYIMARQMDGDETLASGSIALSTLLSAISLAVALLLSPL
jgi:predicted permease